MMITIPAETTLVGELRSKGRIRVEGHIEGNGDIDGLLLLTNQGVWKGKLVADEVIIEGTFEGDIIARKRLELYPQARVNGRFVCPAITIREGAKINGEMKMKAPDAPIGLLENRNTRETPVKGEEEKATVAVKAVGE